jgi:uncharacterized protein (DUF1778 family)
VSQPDRGPVVIDTSVYSARFGPRRGHRLASEYQAVLEGRTEIISFVTVAEMRFGARLICTPIRPTMGDMATKDSRIAVRLTSEQDALIRRAAEAEGTDLTNFTVTATLAHARDVLADRRLFLIDDAAWRKFLAALDRPVAHKPRLAKLFAEAPIFDDE